MLPGLRSLLISTKSVSLTSLSTVYRRNVPRGRMLLLLAVSLKASPTEASVLACSQQLILIAGNPQLWTQKLDHAGFFGLSMLCNAQIVTEAEPVKMLHG